MTTIRLPPHPNWGVACETYAYDRDDGTRCVQAKYRNGADSPKRCAWWAQGTDGEYHVSHGDVKLERLKPSRHHRKRARGRTCRAGRPPSPQACPSAAPPIARRL